MTVPSTSLPASWRVEPLHPEFGARITGIDLNAPLDDDQVEALRAAIDTFSLLHFPDQHLDDRAQLALTEALGEPEANHVTLGRTGKVDPFHTIGKVLDDGTRLGNSHQRTVFQTGNNMWHSDSSFRPVPTYVSIMSAHEVPAAGGETEFISARAAYDRLPAETRARIDPLVVIHDYVYSRSKVAPVDPSHAASLPPVRQRFVRANTRTGARNLYLGSHARSVEGWSDTDSRTLIEGLMAEATRPDSVYSHRWAAGDLVIWDNRCLLHRGAGYDADAYRRRMRQTRVVGAGRTLDEVMPPAAGE